MCLEDVTGMVIFVPFIDDLFKKYSRTTIFV